MQENMKEYLTEKEAREKRLEVYTEKIQEKVLSRSSETIRQLVEERHRQKMTQQEIADITGIKPSNMARFESGGRVPTLVVLEKYANALGKHIEIKICDDWDFYFGIIIYDTIIKNKKAKWMFMIWKYYLENITMLMTLNQAILKLKSLIVHIYNWDLKNIYME